MMGKNQLITLVKPAAFALVIIASATLAFWFSQLKNSDYSTKRVEVLGRADVQPPEPDKSFYVKMSEAGAEEAVEFQVPFRIKQLWWWESEQGTEFRIELTQKTDPHSENYQRCGFTIEITVDHHRKMIWFGHNLQHSAFSNIEKDEVILARVTAGSVITRGKMRQVGNLIWIVVPAKGFSVDAVRMFYTPSKEAFEASAKQMTMISSWVKDSQPWGNRVRRLHGNLKWVETVAQR